MSHGDWDGLSKHAVIETLECYRAMAMRYERLLSDALLANARLMRELRELTP